MKTIRLHLDREEFTPIERLAGELHVTPEAIVYAGLNALMARSGEASIRKEIIDQELGRREGLPRWADGARGVHIYESKHDE